MLAARSFLLMAGGSPLRRPRNWGELPPALIEREAIDATLGRNVNEAFGLVACHPVSGHRASRACKGRTCRRKRRPGHFRQCAGCNLNAESKHPVSVESLLRMPKSTTPRWQRPTTVTGSLCQISSKPPFSETHYVKRKPIRVHQWSLR